MKDAIARVDRTIVMKTLIKCDAWKQEYSIDI